MSLKVKLVLVVACLAIFAATSAAAQEIDLILIAAPALPICPNTEIRFIYSLENLTDFTLDVDINMFLAPEFMPIEVPPSPISVGPYEQRQFEVKVLTPDFIGITGVLDITAAPTDGSPAVNNTYLINVTECTVGEMVVTAPPPWQGSAGSKVNLMFTVNEIFPGAPITGSAYLSAFLDEGCPSDWAIGVDQAVVNVPPEALVTVTVTIPPTAPLHTTCAALLRASDGSMYGSAATTLEVTITAIELSNFYARRTVGGIEVVWETASEIDNVGFRIWRSETGQEPFVLLTSTLIPAEGNVGVGASYRYLDTTASAVSRYWYKLEDVDTHAVSTFHGPVYVGGLCGAVPNGVPDRGITTMLLGLVLIFVARKLDRSKLWKTK